MASSAFAIVAEFPTPPSVPAAGRPEHFCPALACPRPVPAPRDARLARDCRGQDGGAESQHKLQNLRPGGLS